MRDKTIRLFLASATVALLCLALPASAEEAKAAKADAKADAKAPAGAPAMTPEQQKQMEEYKKFATPGEHHAHLKAMEGTWKTTAKMQMDPSAPAQESKGTSVNKMILGGRFLQQEFKGDFMGQPFEGFGITGYDVYKKKYVGMWMDTMGTMMMTSEGTCSEGGRTMEFTASFDDPATKQKKSVRETVRIVSPTQHVFEMFDTAPDGKEFRVMEITYSK